MSAPLLVVQDAFASRRDTAVLPRFDFVPGTATKLTVRLVRPDGTTAVMSAEIDVAHVRGDRPPFAMLRLVGVAPDAVPVGTAIHREDR